VIGNDVVSRQMWSGRSEQRLRRYADKILTKKEREAWQRAPSAKALFRFWACKEAAYKAWSSGHKEARFSPKAFEVHDFAYLLVSHISSRRKFVGRLKQDENAISVTLQENHISPFLEVKYTGTPEQSLEALTQALSDFMGQNGQVVKEGSIPFWVTDTDTYSMSISHCGLTTSWVVSLEETMT
jgi:phosphopantetheine--protein transferase-like protein